jgi:hypothetical protein
LGFQVEEIAGRRSLDEFISIAFDLYRDDPLWVAPIRSVQRHLLDPGGGHPFHKHGEVAFFIARNGSGRALGRIAAIVNTQHNNFHSDKVGFFGFLEAHRDQEVFGGLVDAAAGWLRNRGMSSIRGPVNFSTNEEIGALVKGFDRPPALMMTYNPPWYGDLIEGCGLSKVQDVIAYCLTTEKLQWDRLRRISEVVRKRTGVEIRPLRRKKLYEDVLVLMDVYNECWNRNWGFVPMTDLEFRQMADELGMLVIPELGPIAYVEGEAVAFAVGLPDANQAFIRARGSLLRALFALKVPLFRVRIDGMRVLLLGVREKWRNSGLEALLICQLIENGLKQGFTWGEFSWILEDNVAMRRILEKELSAEPYKTYRIYEKSL